MARAVALAVVTTVAWVALTAAPALGHGPCGCLDPRVAEPGREIAVRAPGADGVTAWYPAYRIVFNPRPSDLGIAPSYLASAHRADGPTSTVLSRPRTRPTRRGRFRIPRGTPAGLYLVLIFDGGEGGAHNTWDYLHVVREGEHQPGVVTARRGRAAAAGAPPLAGRPARPVDAGSGATWWAAGAAALAGLVAVLALRRRRRTSP